MLKFGPLIPCFFLLQVIEARSLFCHRIECALQGVDWVCGSDGRSYPNLCELERIRCFGVAVRMHAKGKCRRGPPETRSHHQKRLSGGLDGFHRNERCNKKEWERFQRSLTKFWRKDYFKKPRNGADISLSIEKRVLHYNFDRIDTDRDDQVSSPEWKHYRTNEKHPIKGRCSRNLMFKCDQNVDRQLDRTEWMQCLYANPFAVNPRWYHPRKKDVPKKKKFQKPTLSTATATVKEPCRPTLVENFPLLDKFAYKTDCSQVVNPPNPNCTGEKNLRFLQRLFSQFKTEMIFVGRQPNGNMRSARRQAAIWKFDHLDSNGDRILTRPEWHSYRQFIKYWDGVRKCGRSFFIGCDSNGDKQIDLEEWNACTVLAYEQATRTPKLDRNPFVYLLKAEN